MLKNIVKHNLEKRVSCPKLPAPIPLILIYPLDTELITHLRCFNSHNIHILHDLVDKLTLSLSYISKETPVHAFLPHVCCAFNMILEEGKSHVDQLCLKKTGPETGKFFMNVIRSTVADAMDLGCSGHATLDQCQQKIPRAMSIFSNITGVMKEKPGVTPLVPLLEILQKLDSSRDDNDSHRSSNRRGWLINNSNSRRFSCLFFLYRNRWSVYPVDKVCWLTWNSNERNVLKYFQEMTVLPSGLLEPIMTLEMLTHGLL